MRFIFNFFIIIYNMYLNRQKLKSCNFLYGVDQKYIDVSNIMKNILELNSIRITNDLFKTDPAPCVVKNLKILNYKNDPIYIKEKDYIYMDDSDMPDLIKLKNISEIKNIINTYNSVKVFGKGPTFKNIDRQDNAFHIAINQAANLLDDVDMLVINDFHNIFKITPEAFKKIKFILTPFFLNINCLFNINGDGHWKNAYDYAIKNGFTGKYIVYNLAFCPPNNQIITLNKAITSAHSGIEFICKYCNIKNIYTYGVAKGLNYGNDFTGNGIYNEARIQYIYNNLMDLKNTYNINIIIN